MSAIFIVSHGCRCCIHAILIGMNDETLAQRGDRVLSGVQSHVSRLTVTGGRGPYLYADGPNGQQREILDLASGIAVTSTGHCHPDVVHAIQDQASRLIHACAGIVYYDGPVQLAEQLRTQAGLADYQFFFTQSGTESIEAALKLARFVTKKPRFLAFDGGFHGRSLGAVAVSSKYHATYQPLMGPVDFLPYPNTYHADQPEAVFIANWEAQLAEYMATHHADLAAVIIEPMLGEGGYVPAPAACLQAVARLCQQYGVLFILDEIQTGFGRTGHWFAHQRYGVDPDVITLAKGMGSGMPIGAMAAKASVMAKWDTGAHGGTYCGNPVCAAAARATIQVLEPLIPTVNPLAHRVMAVLQDRLADHPYVGDIRGLGLMIGIECVADRATRAPNPQWVKTVMAAALDSDVLVIACGGTVIRLMPPLIITEAQLLDGIERLCAVMHAHR